MKYRRVLSRRTILRGAGSVAVGLPFLDEMRVRSVWGQPEAPPVRALNGFFGLGYPRPLQSEEFAGPLEPLSFLRDKLAVVRGVDQVRCDLPGDNAHYDGATAAFNAEPSGGQATAGGPSLDQVLREHAYPQGQPAGVVPSVLMGTFFRRNRVGRYVHCWKNDGSPADLVRESPPELFDRIFGAAPAPAPSDDPEAAQKQRLGRSILDSLVSQYQHYQSDASNLGKASRARIKDHLDRLREYEQRTFGAPNNAPPSAGCALPSQPGSSRIPHGNAADPDGQGIDITLTDLVGEWRLMADLFALGVQCDMIRFGGFTFQAAGERIRLTGRYEYAGNLIYDFNDLKDRGVGGDKGCSHEYWHDFGENKPNTQLRAHLHLMMRELGYLLGQLDDPIFADANGRSILENSLLSISTESGDGRHSDSTRELSGILHILSAANGRFRVGQFHDVGAEGLDLYNTVLEALGVPSRLGPQNRQFQRVAGILA